jgi:hypothetical protein
VGGIDHEADQSSSLRGRIIGNGRGRRFAIAPMMEWTDRAEKQSVTST